MTESVPFAGSEMPTEPMRPILIGEKQALTNLPEGMQPYHPATGPDNVLELNMSLVDQIPPGRYVTEYSWKQMADPDDLDGVRAGTSMDDRTIIATEHGKAVAYRQYDGTLERSLVDTALVPLFKDLGYSMEQKGDAWYATGYPTPHTLQRTAEAYGVPVRLLGADELRTTPDPRRSKDGTISGGVYLTCLSHGEYPISVVDESMYVHDSDINYAHFLAVIAGGSDFIQVLQRVAQDGLQDPARIDELALAIDGFTGSIVIYLREYAASTRDVAEDAAYKTGAKLGLDQDEVRHILDRAEERLQTIG